MAVRCAKGLLRTLLTVRLTVVTREAGMRNSTRKKILLAVIVLVALVALRMFGLLQDVTAVAY